MAEDHPEPQLLEEFMRGGLTGEPRRRVVRHLLTACPRCREVTRRLWRLGEERPAGLPSVEPLVLGGAANAKVAEPRLAGQGEPARRRR